MRVLFELSADDTYVTPLTIADAIVHHCHFVNSDPDIAETIGMHIINEARHIRDVEARDRMCGETCERTD